MTAAIAAIAAKIAAAHAAFLALPWRFGQCRSARFVQPERASTPSRLRVHELIAWAYMKLIALPDRRLDARLDLMVEKLINVGIDSLRVGFLGHPALCLSDPVPDRIKGILSSRRSG